jgi:uncharacterized protein YjbJ (UPF0337 family)
MNKDQLLGSWKIAMGRLQEKMANFSGDQEHRRSALQLQDAGKVLRTVGNARIIIKRSIKQQMSALSRLT